MKYSSSFRRQMIITCFLTTAVLLESCGPSAPVPTPHLVKEDANAGLADGAVIDDTRFNLGWSTERPLVAGEDIIIFEILYASGATAYSTTFSNGEYSAWFNALIGPESRVNYPDSIRDFYMT